MEFQFQVGILHFAIVLLISTESKATVCISHNFYLCCEGWPQNDLVIHQSYTCGVVLVENNWNSLNDAIDLFIYCGISAFFKEGVSWRETGMAGEREGMKQRAQGWSQTLATLVRV